MAEPVSLQTVLTYLTLISVPVGVFYHIMMLRNAQKSRKTEMLMRLHESKYDREGLEALFTLINLEWEDLDDYMEKYSGMAGRTEIATMFESQSSYMDSLGFLVKNGTVDLDTVYHVACRRILFLWFKLETIIKAFRDPSWGTPDYAENFEYLANEMIKIRKQKGLPIPYLVYLHPKSTLRQELI
jgi:hypothetical protein